ncbi:probable LRR receptor-like serine/threonine-protein kinase [Tanacetum coccineum]
MWSEKDHEAMQLNHRWLKFCTTDLSFNFLDSPVPDSIGRLPEFRTVFLNNNSLSGAIPAWVFTANNNRKIDLSYNNFTETQQRNCVPSSLNLVASLASSQANNQNSWCLTDGLTYSRNPNHYNLFINSGGSSLEFEGNEYEQDLTNEQSYFFPSDERWAYSSNGVYLNNDNVPFVASTANVTGGDIYSTARLAPFSLRYYGLCLRQGFTVLSSVSSVLSLLSSSPLARETEFTFLVTGNLASSLINTFSGALLFLKKFPVGCFRDALRCSNSHDWFDEFLCVIPAFMVIEGEVLNDFPGFVGILIAEFVAGSAVNLTLKMKGDMIIKNLDLKPTIDAIMRDFLEVSLQSFAVLLGGKN